MFQEYNSTSTVADVIDNAKIPQNLREQLNVDIGVIEKLDRIENIQTKELSNFKIQFRRRSTDT